MMKLIHGDCLKKMAEIESQSIDMVFADLPYGTTRCRWDSRLDLNQIWQHLRRICKPKAPIVMTAVQPFTTILIGSNIKAFRHNWVWQKTVAPNFLNAKKHPLKKHEDVIVFGFEPVNYFPQMVEGKPYVTKQGSKRPEYIGTFKIGTTVNKGMRYPSTIQYFSNNNAKNIHPTQKPLSLLEYLINTYSIQGDTVLDFCFGSGTSGVACKKLNRHFIGIEKDERYFNAAKERIEQA